MVSAREFSGARRLYFGRSQRPAGRIEEVSADPDQWRGPARITSGTNAATDSTAATQFETGTTARSARGAREGTAYQASTIPFGRDGTKAQRAARQRTPNSG